MLASDMPPVPAAPSAASAPRAGGGASADCAAAAPRDGAASGPSTFSPSGRPTHLSVGGGGGGGGGGGPSIRWDEATIAEHDRHRGTRMRITEPKTPFETARPGSADSGSGAASVASAGSGSAAGAAPDDDAAMPPARVAAAAAALAVRAAALAGADDLEPSEGGACEARRGEAAAARDCAR